VLNGVTSNGATYDSMDYASFMLTAPSGQNFEFLGSTGDGTDGDDLNDSGSGLLNATITVADNASVDAPVYPSHWAPQSGTFTVKPSSYYLAPANNSETQPPLPVGGNSTEWAQSDGSATFASQFETGATPSGTWTLTLTDNDTIGDLNGDPVSVTSWSLVMTVMQSTNANTTTSLSSSSTNNSSFTTSPNNSVTLTATVTSSGSTPTGTVKFSDGGNTIGCAQGNPVAVSSGEAQCTTTFTTEGIHSLEASYSGGTGFNASNSQGLNQFVKNHSTLTSGEYCNAGAIVENASTVSPYPSVVNVGTDTAELSNTVANLTVTLKGLSDTLGLGTVDAFLLVAPDRTKAYDLDFFSDAGTSSSQPSVNVSFADLNPSAPLDGPLTSTTYEATDNYYQADTFSASQTPAPTVPGTINYAQPDSFGTNPLTFAQAFGGANGNGDWALFAINNTGTTINVTGGWCLSFTVNNGLPTTITLAPGTHSMNPSVTGTSVTLTATVTSNGNPVTSGTVTFTENGVAPTGSSANMVTLNGSGQASISTSALTEGDHNITATYSGVSETYDPGSTSFWQRVNTATTFSGAGTSGSPAIICNPGGITLPNQVDNIRNEGAAAPNPSNIFVSNLPGTINSVSLELENFQTDSVADSVLWTSSLLVGPGADTASSIDFFSGTGATNNDTLLARGNYIFSDSGSELVPQSNYGPGTYQPTSYANGQINGSYTPSPSGFYTLPGTVNYAATRGSATFDSLYHDTNPNGTWSLYFYQNTSLDTPATATGWCVDFVENLPAVAVTVPGTGTFTQGQQGASFTVSIEDNGPGSTGDPTGGGNPMTVTDALNPAFTYAGFSGTGWGCSGSGQNVSCTNDSPVVESSSYPELTIDVNVSGTASGSIANSVTASGAGAASAASNTDTITIDAPPAITSASSTTFTVGTAGTFTATGTGQPAPTFGETGPLPNGVTFTGAGVLSGTPAAGTGAAYPITITAQNGASPNATQNFTLTVDQAPAITSANSTTFALNAAGTFTVTATGYPAPTFSETGTLPVGVSLNSAGLLNGSPAASGTYPITITASNGVSPNATQSFTLTVGSPTPIVPYIQDYEQDGGAWQNVSSLTANYSDTVNLGPQPGSGGSWSWTGPSGFTSSSRQLNGISLPFGTNVYTATYTNSIGLTSTLAFTITVAATPIVPYIEVNRGAWQGTNSVTVAPGSIVNLGPQPGSGGTWSWSGPNGFNSNAREIDGIIPAAASSVFTATYTNPAGVTSTETFTITVPPTAITPYIEVNGVWQGTNSVTVAAGSNVNLGPQAAGSGTWSWSGPSFTASTQQVNNVPLTSASNVYTATFTNAAGVISTETFTITIAPTAITPYIEVNNGAWQATNSITVAAGSTVNLGPQASGSGTWSWSGPGFASSAQQVNNVPLTSASNIYTATFTNAAGVRSTETFTITIAPTTIVPYLEVNGGAWQATNSVTVAAGSSVNLGPQAAGSGTWSWSGPSFTASAQQVNNVPLISASNVYTATFTNAAGVISTEAFTITVAPTSITPYLEVNGGAWQGTNSVTVAVGSTVNLGPQASGSGTWSWSGPSYTASTQQVNNIPLNSPSNVYTASFTNAAGVISTETFTITVAPTTITPYIEVNNGAWQGTNSVTVAAGSTVNLGPQPGSGGSWSWAGPNGYESISRQINGIPLSVGSNSYVATYTNPAGVTSMETFTITVE
jgi:hypothetical protein